MIKLRKPLFINIYKAWISHDYGDFTLKINASSRQKAIDIICDLEGCPPNAINKVKKIRTRKIV